MVQERLQQALARQGATDEEATEREGFGQDPDGYVGVTVDERGLLKQIEFDRAMSDLDDEELREATMAALQAAQSGLAPPTTHASPEAALHDSSVADAFMALAGIERRTR